MHDVLEIKVMSFESQGVKSNVTYRDMIGWGVEKLPWKLWEVSPERWKCRYVSGIYYSKKSKFEF